MANGVDAALGDGPGPSNTAPIRPATASSSDPLCSACQNVVAYDMPMSSLIKALTGPDKLDLRDLFTTQAAG